MNILDRARLEKAAQDAGFDLTVSEEGAYLVFRSSEFPQMVGVSMEENGAFRVALSHEDVGIRMASEFGVDVVGESDPWATRLGNLAGYESMHRLFERIASMGRTVVGAGLKEFEEKCKSLPDSTEAIRLVRQRVGQDIFRSSLLEYWDGRCAVSGLHFPELLRASHIKPWADCDSDAERLDVFNGLLLAPHLDALFDGGWVTFLSSGQILISDRLNADIRSSLGISGEEIISCLTDRHRDYLAWHRVHCFRGSVDFLATVRRD